ncbi:MAG: acyltransferase [Mogibacterium sp.]|nr:acyltransferase [Mogibacterium sp.]
MPQQSAPAAAPAKKNRVLWIDILRGLMMYVVIYGHITRFPLAQVHIYSYHMPIFFMISGMTFRFNKVRETGTFIYRKFWALMIPYFVLNLYVSPLREWLERIGECNMQSWLDLIKGVLISNADSHLKMASNTTWFIPCLFVTTVLVFLLQKVTRTDRNMVLALIAIIAVFHAAGQTTGTGGVWHWRVGVVAMVFYVIGYLFMKHIAWFQDQIREHAPKMLALAAVMWLAGFGVSRLNGSCSMIHNRYHNLLLFYLSACLTSFAVIFVVMKLSESERFLRLMQPVNFIGVNTLPYIAYQVPIMKLFWYYIPVFGTHREPWVTILSVMLYFGMMPLAKLVDKGIPKLPKKSA